MSRSDDDGNALIVTLDSKERTKECVRLGLGFGPTVKRLFALVCFQAPYELILSPGRRW